MKHFTELTNSRYKRARSVRCAFDDAYGADTWSPAATSRCEMPVVAVVAAAWGGAALAAGVTGFAAVAALGAVMSGVGVLVGSPELTKIGGVMGLVGGVGSFGASQGWSGFSEMNTALGGEAAAASSTTAAAINAPTVGAPVIDTGASQTAVSMDVGGTPLRTAASEQGILQADIAGGGSRTMSVGEMLNESGRVPPTTNPAGMVDTSLGSPYVPDVGQTGKGLMGLQMGPATPADSGGILDKLFGFAEKNPTAASMLGKGALDFGAAWFKDTDIEDEYKRAGTDLYRERAATEAAQRANASYVPSFASSGAFAPTPGLSPFNTKTTSYTAPRMSGGLMSR